MSITPRQLKKLQITLTSPIYIDAYEYLNNQPDRISSGVIEFPAGTIFSKLKNENGYISGISSEIDGKRYFVYSIPQAERWTLQRNDLFVGYYHGGDRKTRKNKKRTMRKSRR